MVDLSNKHILKVLQMTGQRRGKQNPLAIFYQSSKKVFDRIYEKRGEIRTTQKIDFAELFSSESDSEWLKLFRRSNVQKFVEGTSILNEEDTKTILQEFNEAMRDSAEEASFSETRYDFRNVEEATDEDEEENQLIIEAVSSANPTEHFIILKPKSTFSSSDFKLNYHYYNYLIYLFNKNFHIAKLSDQKSLFTAKLDIVAHVMDVPIPIRQRAMCTAKNEFGAECGNIVTFCDVHKQSKITCTDSLPNARSPGHSIKTVENAISEGSDLLNLYQYSVRDTLDSEEKEHQIFSTVPLTGGEVTGNVIRFRQNKETISILFAVQNDSMYSVPLGEKFLLQDSSRVSCLSDIFESAKQYLKVYHNFQLRNDNKIVAEFLILQLLANIYLDYSFKMAVYGTSGSGKTIWSKILYPLFTPSFSIVNGSSISRNKLLGGKSNTVSQLLNSPYTPGYIATHDVLFLEETTNKLNEFFEAGKLFNKDISGNVFSLLKDVGEKGEVYNVGIQGALNTKVRSSVVLVGNLEQLSSIREEYIGQVRKAYNRFNMTGDGKVFSKSWPIYSQIEYYATVMGNEALAKAHQSVRKELLTRNYVTYLPEAEQGRLTVQIVLEDSKADYVPQDSNSSDKLLRTIHRNAIRQELDEKFKGKTLPVELFQAVNKYLEHEYYRGRNNIVIDHTMNYNIHLRNGNTRLMSRLIYLNKLYWGQKNVNELTVEDKELINYYMLYNYNTLTRKEAATITKPLINDLFFDTDKVYRESESLKEKEQIEKMRQAIEKVGVDVKLSNMFDDAEVLK